MSLLPSDGQSSAGSSILLCPSRWDRHEGWVMLWALCILCLYTRRNTQMSGWKYSMITSFHWFETRSFFFCWPMSVWASMMPLFRGQRQLDFTQPVESPDRNSRLERAQIRTLLFPRSSCCYHDDVGRNSDPVGVSQSYSLQATLSLHCLKSWPEICWRTQAGKVRCCLSFPESKFKCHTSVYPPEEINFHEMNWKINKSLKQNYPAFCSQMSWGPGSWRRMEGVSGRWRRCQETVATNSATAKSANTLQLLLSEFCLCSDFWLNQHDTNWTRSRRTDERCCRLCLKRQVIDLFAEGFTAEQLDAQPAVRVEDW